MTYISEFLSLKCAEDVINSVGYVKGFDKEISEAMGVIKELKKIILKKPNTYSILDLCSGNALVPVLSSFILPVKKAIAIDKHERERKWENVRKFSYLFQDIYSTSFFDTYEKEIDGFYVDEITENSFCKELTKNSVTILTSCHACGALSNRVIEIYSQDFNIAHLILIPCCSGKIENLLPTVINDKCSQYEKWCYSLYEDVKKVSRKVRMFKDNKIQSPRNIIIVAEKY